MKNIVKQSVLNVLPYVGGKPIEEVKREFGLKSVIKLASNENPYPPSPKVLKAIEKAALDINRYPDGSCFYLRQELAKRLEVNPAQIIFGNGSDEIIVMAARAFVRPGDEVVIASPTFLIYKIASVLEDANVKAIAVTPDFRYDLDAMLKAVTKKTRIVFLGNPDNPCGSYIPQKELEKFIKQLPTDVLIFIDEAYFEFVQAKDYGNAISLVKKYQNVLVTRTFSKIYGLAGLRVGYGVASIEVVSWLERLREPFNINSLAQAAALACLKDQPYYRKLAGQVEKERQFLFRSFESLGLKFVKTYTNFILIRVEEDSSLVCRKLLEKGVIVRDMRAWGMEHYIRVSIGMPAENKRLVKTLKEVL
ncbi:MAG: histidinol-phosphate transaminase [Candidatus Omnitrophica bacterium]|nr:histidinol-phosphate transaminase [Candidatus Omnitrophota bacterium]